MGALVCIRSVSLNSSYHNDQECIWFRSGDLNTFWGIRPLMKWKGWGMSPRGALPCIRFMSLNLSYHKDQEYIWFRGRDLNGIWDIRPFMKCRGWGMSPQVARVDPIQGMCDWIPLIIRNTNIYGLGVEIWTISEVWGLLQNERGGASPKGALWT